MIISLVNIGKHFVDYVEKQAGEKILDFKGAKEATAALPEAEILISTARFGSELLKACGRLKWLYIMSAGVETLPFSELDERGVTVTNVGGIHGIQISEHVLGMMLSFSRRLQHSFRNQLKHRWEDSGAIDELAGKTLCIVGAGKIGREVARKASVFDLRVIGLKKRAEPLEHFDEVLGMDSLHEVLPRSDYILLLAPLTDETYHMIGREEFVAMKRSAVFLNMSRGDTVDEQAMIEALRAGRIAGAGLDVFHEEPLPESSPLWDMENVIITPHSAGDSPHYVKRAMELFLESLACYRQERPMPNRIDLKRKY